MNLHWASIRCRILESISVANKVPEDLVLEIQNLPDLQIGLLDGGINKGTVNIDLKQY